MQIAWLMWGPCSLQRMKRPLPAYMTCVQTDITASMRGILTDWLVEVAQEYKLKPDTLFQCVALVDRYLSVRRVQRNRCIISPSSSLTSAPPIGRLGRYTHARTCSTTSVLSSM